MELRHPSLDGRLRRIGTAAAQRLDLQRCRRIVHLGGDAEVLAAFLDTWPLLMGDWFVTAAAQAGAQQKLQALDLGRRMRTVAGEQLDSLPAAEVLLVSAIDPAVSNTLHLLSSASRNWLPAFARVLILRQQHPHLSSVVGHDLLQQLGLRLSVEWTLGDGISLLVCHATSDQYGLLGSLGGRSAVSLRR